MATVIITPGALAELAELPKKIKARVYKVAVRLEKWPQVSGYKALSGNLAGWYRMRTGDYRVRFRVEGETVVIDHIGHRSKFYEG
jgi:mRNA interferase RelE/StbE